MSAKPHCYKRISEEACYLTEKSLHSEFAEFLRSGVSRFCAVEVAEEFNYLSGKTDLVAKNSGLEIIAFELKLSDWKKAFHQARRSESFAHFRYVVLPSRRGNLALQNRDLFERFGVGLILLSGVSAEVAIEAKHNTPLMPWLSGEAAEFIANEQGQFN